MSKFSSCVMNNMRARVRFCLVAVVVSMTIPLAHAGESDELCKRAYQMDGKSPSYYDGICFNHPRSKEKWMCIINRMNKGDSMFSAESYCGA